MRRRVMLGCGALVGGAALLLGIVVLAVGSAFLGNTPVEPGRQLADGRVTTVLDSYVACFLVETSEGFVLVDGCTGPDPVAAALAERGAALSDVRLVLLTHGHDDHLGVAQAWDVPVRALAAEVPVLHGEAPFRGPIPGLSGASDRGVRIHEALADGEEVVVGDTRFEVFAVPGHTAGSAAFLAHGVLFIGDSGGWKTDGVLAPAPWVFSDDVAENVRSMKLLGKRLADRAGEIEWIVPAHTGPAPGLEPLLAME